jgi:hypothetical protein
MRKYAWSGATLRFGKTTQSLPCGGSFETDEEPWLYFVKMVHTMKDRPVDVRIWDAETGEMMRSENPWHRSYGTADLVAAFPEDA